MYYVSFANKNRQQTLKKLIAVQTLFDSGIFDKRFSWPIQLSISDFTYEALKSLLPIAAPKCFSPL